MSGPQNAVIGEDDPTTLPVSKVDEAELIEEKKLARYSQTAEFKRLREFLEARIKFFQNYLPDGRPVKDINLPSDAMAVNWKAANIVVGEFKGLLSEYDNAREVVKEFERRQNT